ncbi:MAG: hypothetical protein R3E97_21650 [Candidatus Eisenbacteria bacterium]
MGARRLLRDGQVAAFLVQDDVLYVAGMFTEIDGVAANRIARFDGTTFEPLGDGFRRTSADSHPLRRGASRGGDVRALGCH